MDCLIKSKLRSNGEVLFLIVDTKTEKTLQIIQLIDNIGDSREIKLRKSLIGEYLTRKLFSKEPTPFEEIANTIREYNTIPVLII